MSNKDVHNKTIEELENDFWEPPSNFPTQLVKDVFQLRKKSLRDLTSNDLRILISQKVGLKYVMPKGIDILKEDILHEAMYYPGDLLLAILNIDDNYWAANPSEIELLYSLLVKSKPLFITGEESDEVDEELIESVNNFISKNEKR